MTEMVHLHVHSDFSLLDGLGKVKDLTRAAAEMGMRALALTDHGVMFGTLHFYHAAKKAGLKPIIGCEMYIAPRGMADRDQKLDGKAYHLVLLAADLTGYHNLIQIATAAQLEGFYYKPRVDKDYLAAHAQGLIALSSCGSGEVPRHLQDNRPDRARQAAEWYRDVFGPAGFYLELQEHDIPEMAAVNRQLVLLAREAGLPLVATNDVHYVRRDQAYAHEILLCIGTGKTMNDPARMRMNNDSYYLRSPDEMGRLFAERPDALRATLDIAERCHLDLDAGGYHLPLFTVPDGLTPEAYLRRLTEAGLRRQYGAAFDGPAVQQRLAYELSIIHQMGFDVYFLIVWDLCEFARRQDMWWNVRGSAAGSIVAYGLGITNLDPLAHNLLFERFLNPNRVTMPDIDLDFPDDRREEMIQYTQQKYGADKVAQIITFGTLGAKAAIRDVGRALDIPLGEADKVARLVPGTVGVTLDDALEQVPDLRQMYEGVDYVRTLVDAARQVEGVSRHASTHAAGVVVTDKPLVEYTPLHRATRDAGGSLPVVQYTMDVLEETGLLKIDFLGLSTLTILRKAVDLIQARHGIAYTQQNIPLDDPKIYELLARGDVIGIFQVEGAGMRRVLTAMKPSKFDHVVAAIALYRPGPIEFIDDYIAGMHGVKKPEYVHPALEPILGETFGICVSGEAIVFNARDGRPYRLDELGEVEDVWVQGIDERWQPAVARVTNWMANGAKPVWQLTLRNGAQCKITPDHRLLTETGWRPLCDLRPGDHVAAPMGLMGPAAGCDRRKLRVLAYLLADGDIGNLAAVNFVSKDPVLLAEYERCLAAWPNLRVVRTRQVRDVWRIGVAKDQVGRYHDPNSLLAWMRGLGLKHASRPGACRSAEKFVPAFVFGLCPDDIAWFLASLWDCDGHVDRKLAHYRTISKQLAFDVQALLLRLGILAYTYSASYANRTSYQITVYDAERFNTLIRPHLITDKRLVEFRSTSTPDISRSLFVQELEAATGLSKRGLMHAYGIDRQHFMPKGLRRARIPAHVVAHVAEALDLTETRRRLNVNWQEIIDIQPAGVEPVYDLTVEGLHSFVANGIIVHNCVFQEQIIRILTDIAGFTPGNADLVRKAVSKKKKDELVKHRAVFVEGACSHSGLDADAANKIFDAFEYFARYGFNKAHSADYAVITCQTAYLKAYYPVEYMTALLTVERGNTEKVGLLLAEAHRAGLPVLPPDVNSSGVDFTIEDGAEDRPGAAIRFGLAAIKNVGQGAVEVLLAARERGGPFKDIDDFCQRVDLRQINRRALECLIKAGALGPFGNRAQLLAVVDLMIGDSQKFHGGVRQASFLDLPAFAATSIQSNLPRVAEAPQKERLAWEKELVGAYLSEHPLSRVWADLQPAITVLTGQIDETMAEQAVTLAGVVNTVRPIVTKKGDSMAFVQLEDLQGTIEVVVFPRVWEQTRALWEPDRILLVRGKVSLRGRDPSIIVDSATTEFTAAVPREPDAPPEPPPPGPVHLHITVPRAGELEGVIRRLGQVYDLLQQHPGADRFSLYVENGGHTRVKIDFPNNTTRHSVALEQELRRLLGAGTISVGPPEPGA